jgi:hypothetical protein
VDPGFTRIVGAEVPEQDPQLDDPTHWAPAGRTLYCIANSGDDRARGGAVRDDPGAGPPAVVRLPLDR